MDCIRLAQQAPTASNSQSWRWVAVDDPGIRSKIADLYREAADARLSRGRESAHEHGELQTERVYSAAEYLAEHLQEVPVHVLPFLCGRPSPGFEGAYFASIYPAAWSFQLALRPRGLGTVLTTLTMLKAQEIGRLLGVPEDMANCGLLPVAYTIGTDFKPAKRPEPEAITHWNGW